MIAALDSSILILLAKVGRLGLLDRLFERVLLAPAVHEEAIAQAPSPAERSALEMEVGRLRFATIRPPADAVARLRARHGVLGTGELETLALVASKKAHVAITDDRIARQAARLEGLSAVGTLGLLAKAHRKRWVSKAEVATLVGQLTAGGLWLSPDVLEAFWKSLGGR